MMLKFRSVSVTAAMMLLSLPATMAGTPNAANYPAVDKVPPAMQHDVTTCPDAHQWGLTYDDGPGPYTADLLSVLASHNQLTFLSSDLGHPYLVASKINHCFKRAWNVDSQDADGALNVAQQFQAKANAGSDPVISLEHDLFATSEPQAGAALDAILAGSGKYPPMPVDKCLGYAAYDEGFWDRVAGKGLPPVNLTLFPAIVLLNYKHCNSDSLSL
ncbi:hypothetical protein BSLG_005094 [Batrachochytrium salamandrivorans]|nr:hypothetical protein BSLG_005094 [Batrachochytrium salamandrivorans]